MIILNLKSYILKWTFGNPKMLKKAQLIVGRDLEEQLIRTLEMCGTGTLSEFVEKENLVVHPKIQYLLDEKQNSEFDWESLLNANNACTFDLEGLDLMKKMLDVHPEQRISIKESFEHPFLN